ncbi:molybdopterin converting factor [Sorangium cellulosum]|uniref:Molybdopterin synthase sulfur carrier subunit n=1 Tax=Sorangium cellulosum TaxID=56 RepID=A0A2L0ERQ0_SORCE|nr:MoaD/ThiS family protein [Sorangium cellulosum]AUX41955.1 molybdopterin converting factor [Sorangium cellulosum]
MNAAVRVLAFAGARDVLGAGEVALPLPGPCTAAELLEQVCARYPGLVPYKGSIRVAVNGVYATPSDPVGFGDEVALIPPVAGG